MSNNQSNSIVVEKIKTFITNNDRFLLTSHVNPDGDGIGSAMALKHALLGLGKQAEIIIDGKMPQTYSFLSNCNWVMDVSSVHSTVEKFKAVITCDAPNIERLGLASKFIDEGAVILNLDHHVSNESFGTIDCVILDAASTTQIVADILRWLCVDLTSDIAESIYLGLIFDTGRFKYSNTTPSVFALAAELVIAGVKPENISGKIYSNKTYETVQALGVFLDSIELHCQGRVSTAQFDLEYTNSKTWPKVDTEGFINYALDVTGVEVACSFREVEMGLTRVSFRAKRDFDVNSLASVWGGGGHQKASGCTLEMKLAEAKKTVLDEVARRL
ncbi:MAG TPA: bifunctional oligoribonuclease/PAP phosphatase NrnA [Nitrospinota bacterium]|jgi:phosphoesterase RecJ-like protein|nr:bifunctional oligoribonuclease/PAP phosphatase NrnA [Nitrospinota bacterium]|tara:strand:- start:150311 stop:151300 length:990 start_codon:yes stop_codon:yes gene_type:complete